MGINLASNIGSVVGVGPKMESKLNKLGVFCVRDLFFNFPRRYLDFTKVTKIADLSQNSEPFTIRGSILAISNKKTRRRGFTVTEAMIVDESGSLKVVWFNQPYLAKMLREGSNVILNGKVSYDGFSGGFVMESPIRTNRPQIIPVYSEVAGISSFFITKLVSSLKGLVGGIEEWMPDTILNPKFEIRNSNDQNSSLLPIQEAILSIHFPQNSAMLEAARRRFAFDELFFISLRASLAKIQNLKLQSQSIQIDQKKIDEFIEKLPFELTGDQKKATEAILFDMTKNVPMNRLLNGDVGSGKTVVAAITAKAVMLAGQKTILMVPTSILAVQHYELFKKLFGEKFVGTVTASKKENTEAPILIGTHALLHMAKKLDNLGLVIVDEQHRFGVAQRAAVHELNNGDVKPHFLSMTATPIPRTLRLALFGDLDISVIAEKPANRKEIKTRFVQAINRDKAYEFIREHLKRGLQAFVICPLIESTNNGEQGQSTLFEEDRKSVLSEYEKLKALFPEFEIGMLHGKMKVKEKEEIMARFVQNEIKMLVSTSVVEVGVDVPNATIMMIEDAERFGLSQLHQFRGRVGRGEQQSFCFLFSNSQSEKSIERLRGIEAINDGFKLAELDLEMRGAGAIFGTEQSGILDLKMASLSDSELIEQASTAAKAIAPEISHYPRILEKIREFLAIKHLE